MRRGGIDAKRVIEREMKMDNSDLTSVIDMVRDYLMSHEEENQFQRIIDRLEGYELAYNLLLQKVANLEEYIGQLEQEHGSMSKSLYKIVRIANKGLED
jgi:hypothetical protein